MSKIIPILLERKDNQRTTRVIDWRLSNICNFNCSFCPSSFKDGSKRYLEYSKYIQVIDTLIDSDTSKTVWFQFTGGEPTLYPKLFSLLKYIKEKGGNTSMISNGSRTTRWWNELALEGSLDRLYLSYHPEQEQSPDHIIEVNNIMQATDTLTTIFVTTQYTDDLFFKAVKDHQKILTEAITVSSLKPISDENILQPYSDFQLKTIQNNLYIRSKRWNEIPREKFKKLEKTNWYQTDMTMRFLDGSTKTASAQYFVEHNLNKFKDWECDIGKDMMIIEIDQVFRGMCKQGGMILDLNNQGIDWQKNSIICQKENCNCSLDIQEPKRMVKST